MFSGHAGVGIAGAPTRLAWGGAPVVVEARGSERSSPSDANEGHDAQPLHRVADAEAADLQGVPKRLFFRPLWPTRAPQEAGYVDQPVVFRFAPGLRDSPRTTDSSPTEPVAEPTPVAEASTSPRESPKGWTEVRFSPHGPNILV